MFLLGYQCFMDRRAHTQGSSSRTTRGCSGGRGGVGGCTGMEQNGKGEILDNYNILREITFFHLNNVFVTGRFL